MQDIDLGLLKDGPHARLIEAIAQKCSSDPKIQAIWVGGSLAAGTGDSYSDIDFRIAVDPSQIQDWRTPDWDLYLPISACGYTFLQFGEHALLHHMVLEDGTLLDFYVQDTSKQDFEPDFVVIACRNEEFGQALSGYSSPPISMIKEIDGDKVQQFFVEYWITTHKQLKAMARNYDHFYFAGLYMERMSLLRAWYMEVTGKDIVARMSIHMINKMYLGLDGELTTQQKQILGLPSTTAQEMIIAVEAIREEMARVGQVLSKRYKFQYPHDLEQVVLKAWDKNREIIEKSCSRVK